MMQSSHSIAGLFIFLLPWTTLCELAAQSPPGLETVTYALAIHGGAGKSPASTEWNQQRQAVLKQALDEGQARLKRGESSLDTVEAVVRILEDSPYFNAGKGAVFNAAETHELDASIMDGSTRDCGAVGGVTTIQNPISLARRVMTDSKHILLAAAGAERFADEYRDDPRIKRVANSFFSTEYRRQQWKRVQRAEQQTPQDSMGTVGCVAFDTRGNLAAATSTGGLTNKRFGRVGDSPIIGAGTYADNATCAVSCTGIGEDFIRHAVAFDVAARIAYRGDSPQEAVRQILTNTQRPVRGGMIAVSRTGQIVMEYNTPGMARAAADSLGRYEIHTK